MIVEIATAQRIVSGSALNLNNKTFHETSFIYRKTNEKINLYKDFLINKKDILSVISSGNQILNSIYYNSENITGFDISIFPKYYLELQIGAINCLTLNEYINFFYGDITNDEIYDDIYFYKIRYELDNNTKLFWDSLFNFYDWKDILDSTLFSSEPVILKDTIEQNVYLQSNDNYNKLKKNIKNIKINYITENIFNIIENSKDNYDLINLSNIITYCNPMEYLNLLKKIKLKKNGYSLTYLFNTDINEIKKLNIENLEIKELDDKAKLLIHK